MNLNLAEFALHRARLRREISERESILAAFEVVHKYLAGAPTSEAAQPGAALSVPVLHALPTEPPPVVAARSVAPASANQSAPDLPYMHPELRALGRNRHGSTSAAVRWAIQRMTEDYSLHDIAALLRREGWLANSSEISVVLTRLSSRGEIQEIQRGRGPKPAIFRGARGEVQPGDRAACNAFAAEPPVGTQGKILSP